MVPEKSIPLRDWPTVNDDSDEVWNSIDMGSERQNISNGAHQEVISAVVGGKIYAVKKSTSEHPTSHVNEINLLCRFKHPNIVRAYSIRFSMSLVENVTITSRFLMDLHTPLYGFMEAYPLNVKGDFEKSYPWLARAEILYGLIDALAFLQDNNVIYGDIGARNVLVKKVVDSSGFNYRAVLTDFGKYHRIGCGTASEVQSQTDLSGYKAAGYTVYENENSKIPLKEEYNVLADAMWALCILVMDISTGHQHLDSNEIEGVGRYVYELREPQHFEQSVYQPFRKTLVPLLKKLTRTPVDRPCYFRDLLKYRLFTVDTDIADRLGRAKGTVRNIDDVVPHSYVTAKDLPLTFRFFHSSITSIIEERGPVVSLAAEYYFRTVSDVILPSKEGVYTRAEISSSFCYVVACFIVSAATLGKRYVKDPDQFFKSIRDELANFAGTFNDDISDLSSRVDSYVSLIFKRTQGCTQWWVPYYDDRFFDNRENRTGLLDKIFFESGDDSYQTFFEKMREGPKDKGVPNEESTPLDSVCVKYSRR